VLDEPSVELAVLAMLPNVTPWKGKSHVNPEAQVTIPEVSEEPQEIQSDLSAVAVSGLEWE